MDGLSCNLDDSICFNNDNLKLAGGPNTQHVHNLRVSKVVLQCSLISGHVSAPTGPTAQWPEVLFSAFAKVKGLFGLFAWLTQLLWAVEADRDASHSKWLIKSSFGEPCGSPVGFGLPCFRELRRSYVVPSMHSESRPTDGIGGFIRIFQTCQRLQFVQLGGELMAVYQWI